MFTVAVSESSIKHLLLVLDPAVSTFSLRAFKHSLHLNPRFYSNRNQIQHIHILVGKEHHQTCYAQTCGRCFCTVLSCSAHMQKNYFHG